MKTNLTFDKAFSDLTELVDEIENDEIQLDTLSQKVKQANELITFCEDSLREIKSETEKMSKGK